jgi:hypothetical protein
MFVLPYRIASRAMAGTLPERSPSCNGHIFMNLSLGMPDRITGQGPMMRSVMP